MSNQCRQEIYTKIACKQAQHLLYFSIAFAKAVCSQSHITYDLQFYRLSIQLDRSNFLQTKKPKSKRNTTKNKEQQCIKYARRLEAQLISIVRFRYIESDEDECYERISWNGISFALLLSRES